MGVYELIKSRRTTYSFIDKPVKEENIIKILDAARLTPAAGGIHEYEFIVVMEPGNRKKLGQICLTPNIESAPAMIVVICDPEKLINIFGEEGESVLCPENAAMAIENIILYATELGLGTAWISNLDQVAIRKALGVPDKYVVRGIVALGYPSNEKPGGYNINPPSLKDMVHEESFNNKAE